MKRRNKLERFIGKVIILILIAIGLIYLYFLITRNG